MYVFEWDKNSIQDSKKKNNNDDFLKNQRGQFFDLHGF